MRIVIAHIVLAGCGDNTPPFTFHMTARWTATNAPGVRSVVLAGHDLPAAQFVDVETQYEGYADAVADPPIAVVTDTTGATTIEVAPTRCGGFPGLDDRAFDSIVTETDNFYLLAPAPYLFVSDSGHCVFPGGREVLWVP